MVSVLEEPDFTVYFREMQRRYILWNMDVQKEFLRPLWGLKKKKKANSIAKLIGSVELEVTNSSSAHVLELHLPQE